MNGLLLVDKPKGLTSHDVVYRVRRALGIQEVGHAGTLDPMATGLMVVLLGEATKLSELVTVAEKTYQLKIEFGFETDAWDMDGVVTHRSEVKTTRERIIAEAMKLQGDMELEVPSFSAKKKNGKKLYELAHAGKETPILHAPMGFSQLEIIDATDTTLEVRFFCKKGSYVRSWSHTLGRILGTGATLTELRRLRSEPYGIEKAVTLEQVTNKDFGNAFIPISECLPSLRAFYVDGQDEKLMKAGQIPHRLFRRVLPEMKDAFHAHKSVNLKVLSKDSGLLLSLLEIAPEKGLKIRRIFRNDPQAVVDAKASNPLNTGTYGSV